MMRLVIIPLVVLISISLSAGYRHRYRYVPEEYEIADDESWYQYREDYHPRHPRHRLPIIEKYDREIEVEDGGDHKTLKEKIEDSPNGGKIEKMMKEKLEASPKGIKIEAKIKELKNKIEESPGMKNPETKAMIKALEEKMLKLDLKHKKLRGSLLKDYAQLAVSSPLAFDIMKRKVELQIIMYSMRLEGMILAKLLDGGPAAEPQIKAPADAAETLKEKIEESPNGAKLVQKIEEIKNKIEESPGMQNPETKKKIKAVRANIVKLEVDQKKVQLNLLGDYKKLQTALPVDFDIMKRHMELDVIENTIKRDRVILAALYRGVKPAQLVKKMEAQIEDAAETLKEKIEDSPNGAKLGDKIEEIKKKIDESPGMQNPETKKQIEALNAKIGKLELAHEKVQLKLLGDYKKLKTASPIEFDILALHKELDIVERTITRDRVVLAALYQGVKPAELQKKLKSQFN